ncbi:tetratricopeptide repeat-containing protein [Maricaulis salignorans]|uniref:tetratricopeptide repeat-containing protein n=1 Tax=Maricaulis salignorans TaxID=144026 RepID=UPI003A8FD879
MRRIILERFNQGDLARAYDLCLAALAQQPDDGWFKHRAVLCLVRSGALERAELDFRRFRLSEASHDEDSLALGARLSKSMALEAHAEAVRPLAAVAAAQYQRIFSQTGGHYPGINAATLYLLAGDGQRADALARKVLACCRGANPTDAEEAYYRLASQAEAHLLLGDSGAAQMALESAIACDRGNSMAHATTIRQLRMVKRLLQLSAPWLHELEPPGPCHFAGHLFHAGGDADGVAPAREAGLSLAIAEAFERENIGPCYGAIAAGADILVAEVAIARGNELHLVLPVPVNVFIDASVRPLGGHWVRRCEACLSSAAAIHEVTTDRKLLSGQHIRFASEVAMGLARMRASALSTSPVQLLVADDAPPADPFGTAHDRDVWQEAGLRQIVVPATGLERYHGDDLAKSVADPDFRQVLRAMLFIDVCGSSTVADDLVPVFVTSVMSVLAQVCDALEPAPLHADSWGDGLFLAFRDVDEAARAADTLRRAFSAIDLVALGLPEHLALRIGGHYGPVHEAQDPLRKTPTLFGGQVAIASRIERATLPGSIFVSAFFAAALAMARGSEFRCEYVGQTAIDALMPEIGMYSLRAVAADCPAALDAAASIGGA